MSKLEFKRYCRLTKNHAIRYPNPDHCWEWDGPTDNFGYATVCNKLAHRISHIMYKGPIPEGVCVLHTCDNPPCTNPRHLWLGTRADNIRDMIKKGRDRHPSVLSFAQVLRMRRAAAKYRETKGRLPRGFYARMGERYGITRVSIWLAVNFKTYRHLSKDGYRK